MTFAIRVAAMTFSAIAITTGSVFPAQAGSWDDGDDSIVSVVNIGNNNNAAGRDNLVGSGHVAGTGHTVGLVGANCITNSSIVLQNGTTSALTLVNGSGPGLTAFPVAVAAQTSLQTGTIACPNQTTAVYQTADQSTTYYLTFDSNGASQCRAVNSGPLRSCFAGGGTVIFTG